MLSRMLSASVLRAAAILTNAAVRTSLLNVQNTLDGVVGVQIDVTLGSLTNVIVNPQVSPDGTNWYDVSSPGPLTLTATGSKAFTVDCSGFKYFALQLTGTGTVTSSSATAKVGYKVG